MARRAFSRPLRQGQRRKTEWIASADITAVQAIAGNTVVLLQSFTGAQFATLGPVTITRVRGLIHVVSDQLAVSEVGFGAVGFMIVSEKARALGATALPGPITQEDLDAWFLWQPIYSDIAVNSAIGFDSSAGRDYPLESKAMRKVESEEALVYMGENATTQSMLVASKFRILLKLH